MLLARLGAAYLPRVFVPDARDVLVIGFGSGTTPGASLLFPETRVVAWEIEPAVYEARTFFDDASHRTAENPLFSIAFGDGRTSIQGSDQRWDLILSEPSNPWLAGVSNLPTREHFRAARVRLREGGVLAQWVQTHRSMLRDYALILRTLRGEFPHWGVIVLAGGADTLLLASDRPLLPSPDAIASLQRVVDATPRIHSDLARWFGGRDLRRVLVAHSPLGREEGEAPLAQDASDALDTDLRLRLEFGAPLHLFRSMQPGEGATGALLAATRREWIERLGAQIGIAPGSADHHLVLGDYHWNRVANPTLGPSLEGGDARGRAARHDERAAALAEVGRFDEAIQVAGRIQRLAAGRAEIAGMAEQRLALFRAAQPVREE